MNGAIKVHVKNGVLTVKTATGNRCQFIPDEENPIVSGIRLDLGDGGARSCPGLDSRLHTDGSTDR